jgi:2-dehydro-3-deoxyphosphogluconate aldolase/(4S)-4-hydroxy-2-oxoglutarate aldolase
MSEVLSRLTAQRLVPVVVIDRAADADPLASALVAGGLPVAEVTFRTDAAERSIAIMAARGDILVGAGTVITPAQVDQAVGAGARFVVSPGISAAVVRRCRERDIPVFPGATTATEIQAALELGLSTLKFFPAASSGGEVAIRALAAPFSRVSFIPTGGIDLANLERYLSIPTVVAVGGSWMVPSGLVRVGDFDAIAHLSAEAVAAARA